MYWLAGPFHACVPFELEGLVTLVALLCDDVEVLTVGVVPLTLSTRRIEVIALEALPTLPIISGFQTGKVLDDALAQFGLVLIPGLAGSSGAVRTVDGVGNGLVKLRHAAAAVVAHPAIVADVALSSVAVVVLAEFAERLAEILFVHMSPALAVEAACSTP